MKQIEIISIDKIGLVGGITRIIRRVNGRIISHTASVNSDKNNVTLSLFCADVILLKLSTLQTLTLSFADVTLSVCSKTAQHLISLFFQTI